MPTSASSPVRKLFDYDSLDNEDAVFVQQQTGAIQSLIKRSAQDVWDIGQRLIEVKRRLRHGRFEAWLNAEFEWTQMTATRFINVAKRFKSNNLLDLTIAPSALYELAAPSTREDVRAEAIARAKAGETITYTAAKNIKQRYAPPKKEPQSSAPQVPPVQPDNLQERAWQNSPTPPQSDTATAQADTSPQPTVASQPIQTKVLQPPDVRDTPPQPLPSSSSHPASITPPAPPVSSTPPAPVLEQQRTSVPESQVQSASAPSLTTRQRATELTRPQLEIMAIRPKEADLEVSEEDLQETVVFPEQRKPSFVQAGTWWQFAKTHLLYCGDPTSSRFRERLPEQVALFLAFPPERKDWPQPPDKNLGSAFTWFTRFQHDQDVKLLGEMIERSLMLATEGGDFVVFSFLPDPSILLMAHDLECRWLCAEPDPLQCERAIATWKEKGFRAEKVSGLRF